ncbi:uncharacterized protein BDR25DRAFT_352937 [Lindgomyces ingoldianus]|uniref:Uncharacterized protein n=1 Tax=Lindgomyces ingoldianus TaxID=673940 RepID=A0ACB6R2Q5_9PLEO|nr:uncharacterized protein BDR25DRAFT_352937 [Lindgomyces ingoldianus]KAF2473529.1 hypothetical protein BDR25DRAFT_352937 [Lindgomyces ingoldianus]
MHSSVILGSCAASTSSGWSVNELCPNLARLWSTSGGVTLSSSPPQNLTHPPGPVYSGHHFSEVKIPLLPHALPYASKWIHTVFRPVVLPVLLQQAPSEGS